MRTVAIGLQDFEDVITRNYFYVDKTAFIKEWWESGDSVTLISRPRRFGKTLNMSMLNRFFSNRFAGKGEVFEGLSIWENEEYHALQGTYPVINLSFANVKQNTFAMARQVICQLIVNVYSDYSFLLESGALSDADKAYMRRVSEQMSDADAAVSLLQLSKFLYQYYGKKVIILLDEYDTPMQEAYVCGFWDELAAFTRSIFNSAFKTNPWLERGLMTGITRVSKESVFSDLNNLEVVTTTSDKYATAFGFTREEVWTALSEFGLESEQGGVKYWYDGFIFGTHKDIYNPWSILNFLDKKKYDAYWANTSANSLVGKLIREGSRRVKMSFEKLLWGEPLYCAIDEQIVYNQLDGNEAAIWSLLLASGYLKVMDFENAGMVCEGRPPKYELALTNYEVKCMFKGMVHGWFVRAESDYNDFVDALLMDDADAMNVFMNRVAMTTFSYFDTGKNPSFQEPERFYHGFVLGLMVDLQDRYIITSNRESGFGRYDVMLEPRNPKEDAAIVLEFKVHNPAKEETLSDTVRAALAQIEKKNYKETLSARGIPAENIRSYGFAFEGKKVLIG